MRKIKRDSAGTQTPIERIFFKVVKSGMTPRERRILLPKPKKISEGN